MNITKILKSIDLAPSKEKLKYLKANTKEIIRIINEKIRQNKIKADVFVGGSFAKNTLVNRENYDIDIFVRFDWKYKDLSSLLERIVRKFPKEFKIERIHGSRDYFRFNKNNINFELIPVIKIKTPKEAKNVTDLSYFHVNYVKRKLKSDLAKEVLIMKQFCEAQGVYGAESYIRGFSGYASECLIIYYKGFQKMANEIIKVKDRIIIDPEKKFKKKEDALIELNESKLNNPIILIDPTWKERNVLAALSREAFDKFQESLKNFIKRPSAEFFKIKEINGDEIKNISNKNRAEFLHLIIETDRQEGDIAGTKMKKFSSFLSNQIEKYFEIIGKEFSYKEGKKADFFLAVKSRKEIDKIGPPSDMKDHAEQFKKKNKGFFIKNGVFHVKIKINFTAKTFLKTWRNNYKSKMKDMGIINFEIK